MGIILSGGPASVYAPDAYDLDAAILDLGIPILGICYGHQVLAHALGGDVVRTEAAEFGRTELKVEADSVLFNHLPDRQQVWMSHRDAVVKAPPGFRVTAATAASPVAAMEDLDRRMCGVQFHPEVGHTLRGQEILRRFLYDVCGARPTWTHVGIIEQAVAAVRTQAPTGRVICGLSGGVDSAVAAALVHRAVGDRLTCVRGPRTLANGRGRTGRGDVPGESRHRSDPRRCRRAIPQRPCRCHRSRAQAHDHR